MTKDQQQLAETNYVVRHMVDDDLGFRPEIFQVEGDSPYELCKHYVYLQFLVEGDEQPHYYMRNFKPGAIRWGGIVKLGDGPLEPQQPGQGHYRDLAQEGVPLKGYEEVSDAPVTYASETTEPYLLQSKTADRIVIKEGDVLDITGEYWPVGMFSGKNSALGGGYIWQPFTFSGTYEGKPVTGIGQFDHCFATADDVDGRMELIYNYVASSVYCGIRKDGRREFFYGFMRKANGYGTAVYWLEGEEPIVTEQSEIEVEYFPLGWVDEGDTTCAFKNITWRFADKEIHFTGKWGSRRFTDHPKGEPAGWSNVFGTWYSGDTPIDYALSETWNETMASTAGELRALGYTVHDSSVSV
ncbi:hypothetical protein [Frondihabitans cladoniiphilus]|uniref:Uncharacterized protein n=1 Tax=Frondihabitans cladoniiphilus TaxID=715785 RepID=A0ABP8VHF5_9MICO